MFEYGDQEVSAGFDLAMPKPLQVGVDTILREEDTVFVVIDDCGAFHGVFSKYELATKYCVRVGLSCTDIQTEYLNTPRGFSTFKQ